MLGGLMAHSVREDAYNTLEYGYQSKFKELEDSGKIKLLQKERIVNMRTKQLLISQCRIRLFWCTRLLSMSD